MTWSVMSDIPNPLFDANGDPYSGAVLKAYLPGTTTSTSIAIDSSGGSPQASITANAEGKWEVSGNEELPYIDRKHKWGIFANATDAAANTPFYMGPFDNVEQVANSADTVKHFATLAAAVASTTIADGDALNIAERTAGNGGGAMWDVVLSSTVTENTYNIVQCTGVGTLSLVLRVDGRINIKAAGAVGDGSNDDTLAIQASIDAITAGVVYMPAGNYKTTAVLYMSKNGIHMLGDGWTATRLSFVNAAGGTCLSGDTGGSTSLITISNCSATGFSIASTAAATDPSICVDLTSFAYSQFDLEVQSKRANAILYYGQGNAGASPYYNRISGAWFGNTDYTQTGCKFSAGLWAGGSAGGNANIFGPIQRAAVLDYIFDIDEGNGNLLSDISGESIGSAYFRFNNRSADDSGTSTGSNGQATLIDTGAGWTTNAYISAAVKLTGGTGSGQTRIVASNTTTTLTLEEPWGTMPDATSTYEIYLSKGSSNKVVNVRAEGLDSNNPDFIQAKPGCRKTTVLNAEVQSLGTGLYVRDESGSTTNKWYGDSQVVMVESILNPGASYNSDLYAKNSVFGGASFAGEYVIEWIKVATTTVTLSDDLDVYLDVGGTAAGNGDMTLRVTIPTGNSTGMAIPASTEKVTRDGTNKGVFVNVQTGASFSATADLTVTWCVTLV